MRMLKNDLNLEVTRGDTFSFGIEIDSLGQELEAAYFTCKNNYDDQTSLFQKILGDGITLDKVEGNNYFYKLRLAPQDTISLEAGEYYYDFQIEANGDVFTILKGVLTLSFDVTERSGTSMAGGIKVDWGNIEGDIGNQTDLMAELNGKANTSHTHAMADVTSLTTELNGKANTSHTHAMADIISGTLPITNGGTGATTSKDAQKNLHFYTSLDQLNLTGPCTTANVLSALPTSSIFLLGTESASASISDAPSGYGSFAIFKGANPNRRMGLFARSLSNSSGNEAGNWFYILNVENGVCTWQKILTDVSTDNSLLTNSKTIVGAINELYQAIQSS